MKPIEKLQTLLTAAAFAEENDHRTAREIASELRDATPKARETRTTITATLAVEHGK